MAVGRWTKTANYYYKLSTDSSRGGRIRTYGLLLPKQARYRATLHPETNPFEKGAEREGFEPSVPFRGTAV